MNTLGLFCEDQEQMEQEYKNLVSSTTFLATQKQFLERIYIEDRICISDIIAVKLNDLSQHLPHLTSLELVDGYFRVGFTIYIFQHLTRLETLSIKNIHFCDNDGVEGLFDQHGPITHTSLKNLQILLHYTAPHVLDTTKNYIDQVNGILQFILQSCPFLEKFELEGETQGSEFIADGASLDLSFLDHSKINEIRLSFRYCCCYVLNGDKKYICYSDDGYTRYSSCSSLSGGGGCTGEAVSLPKKDVFFHVNLSYKSEAAIRLGLLEYPPRARVSWRQLSN